MSKEWERILLGVDWGEISPWEKKSQREGSVPAFPSSKLYQNKIAVEPKQDKLPSSSVQVVVHNASEISYTLNPLDRAQMARKDYERMVEGRWEEAVIKNRLFPDDLIEKARAKMRAYDVGALPIPVEHRVEPKWHAVGSELRTGVWKMPTLKYEDLQAFQEMGVKIAESVQIQKEKEEGVGKIGAKHSHVHACNLCNKSWACSLKEEVKKHTCPYCEKRCRFCGCRWEALTREPLRNGKKWAPCPNCQHTWFEGDNSLSPIAEPPDLTTQERIGTLPPGEGLPLINNPNPSSDPKIRVEVPRGVIENLGAVKSKTEALKVKDAVLTVRIGRKQYKIPLEDGVVQVTPQEDTQMAMANPITETLPEQPKTKFEKLWEEVGPYFEKLGLGEVGMRLAGKQFTKFIQEPLVALTLRDLDPDSPEDMKKFRSKVANFLQTKLGKALIQLMLAGVFSAVPNREREEAERLNASRDISKGEGRVGVTDSFPERMSRELRTSAYSETGDIIVDLIMGPLRDITTDLIKKGYVTKEPAQLPVVEQPGSEGLKEVAKIFQEANVGVGRRG